MVVFTCGHCGESLQKPKVEKHYLTMCRNRTPNLSCMDCFKDFLGNDYETHIKCITEEERYSGKGFTPKEKKGEKKQTAWVEMLQSVLDESKTTSSNVLRIIETISKHNNTPRKKPKFINFVKNVCGPKTNIKDIDQAWDLISVKLSALSNIKGQNGNQNHNNEETKTNGKSDNDDTQENSNEAEKESENKENDEAEKNVMPKINGQNGVPEKKLSKKERKEEKKRRKYEAELQSAEQQPADETNEEVQSKKKGKKNKNKVNDTGKTEDVVQTEENNKIKKRKRQDTVNTIPDVVENDIVTENTNKIKVQQKKQRVQEEEAGESLHDQNVAKNEEQTVTKEKFDWHSVIISVLQKKDNELPFKRLQKKVLSEYSEITGYEIDDRIAEKFIKKLKSAPNVKVDKNRVLLVQESND